MINTAALIAIRLIACSAIMLPFAVFAQDKETLTPEAEVRAAAEQHRMALDFDGETFSGPGWDRLLAEGRASTFFLIGEEHGIAENPKLAAALFAALAGDGYQKFVIEISPSMAGIVEQALDANGLEGLRDLYSQPGGEPAFFGMREEAEMLAAVNAASDGEVLWGVDYEVAGDRALLRELQRKDKSPAADAALATLVQASADSWAKYAETGSPQYVFSFAGDPALVQAVSRAWPDADAEALSILETLFETLSINRLWVQGQGWASNVRRANHFRSNFLKHWQLAQAGGHTPRVMAKLGASHLVRGRNMNGAFDLGALIPELAASGGGRSFSLLVLPGADALVAVLDPSKWSYQPKPAKDGYAGGIEPIIAAAFPDRFTLIDLAAIRPVVGTSGKKYGETLLRIVHGFDMVLVMSGSTPAGEFEHD